jgi:hypothetical protein
LKQNVPRGLHECEARRWSGALVGHAPHLVL